MNKGCYEMVWWLASWTFDLEVGGSSQVSCLSLIVHRRSYFIFFFYINQIFIETQYTVLVQQYRKRINVHIN